MDAARGSASRLSAHGWWHTRTHTHTPLNVSPGADCTEGETALLKWVYGKIVNTQSEDFLGRQRELYAGRERDAVVLDLYEDLAYGWRSLQVCALILWSCTFVVGMVMDLGMGVSGAGPV